MLGFLGSCLTKYQQAVWCYGIWIGTNSLVHQGGVRNIFNTQVGDFWEKYVIFLVYRSTSSVFGIWLGTSYWYSNLFPPKASMKVQEIMCPNFFLKEKGTYWKKMKKRVFNSYILGNLMGRRTCLKRGKKRSEWRTIFDLLK